MATSAREDFPIMLPHTPGQPNPDGYVGDVRQARRDDTGTILCSTCGTPATLHLFRPSCLYRCAACCETWGTVPTRTVVIDDAPVVTLSDTMVPHPAVPA